ncbi:MAG: hypothetical protein GY904_07280 [Planctomycetaceae bacterium]|nr:hypothetical protein [Planctomycetaceae bacterium]
MMADGRTPRCCKSAIVYLPARSLIGSGALFSNLAARGLVGVDNETKLSDVNNELQAQADLLETIAGQGKKSSAINAVDSVADFSSNLFAGVKDAGKKTLGKVFDNITSIFAGSNPLAAFGEGRQQAGEIKSGTGELSLDNARPSRALGLDVNDRIAVGLQNQEKERAARDKPPMGAVTQLMNDRQQHANKFSDDIASFAYRHPLQAIANLFTDKPIDGERGAS